MKLTYFLFFLALLKFSSPVFGSTGDIDECIKHYGFSEVFSDSTSNDTAISTETLNKALLHYNHIVSVSPGKRTIGCRYEVIYITTLLQNIVRHVINNKNIELMEKILLEGFAKKGDGELGPLISEQQLVMVLFFENIDYYLSEYNIDKLSKYIVWPETSFFSDKNGACKTVLPNLSAKEVYCDEFYEKLNKQSPRLAIKIRSSYVVKMTCKIYSHNFCGTK